MCYFSSILFFCGFFFSFLKCLLYFTIRVETLPHYYLLYYVIITLASIVYCLVPETFGFRWKHGNASLEIGSSKS